MRLRPALPWLLLTTCAFASDPVGACAEARDVLRQVPGFPLDITGPARLTPGRKELFLDDALIGRLDGLTRRMHPPVKHGPVIRPDYEGDSIQIRTGPFWNPVERRWMMWYLGGFASSPDGLHWTKEKERNLPATRYEFKDPLTGREILRQDGDGNTINHAIYDAGEPDPRRRYKGAGHKGPLCCLQGGRGPGFYPAISADGRKWQMLETAFVPTADESHFNVDDERRFYFATVKHPGPYGRSVYLAVSRNFDHWSDPRDCMIFSADKRDQVLGAERVRMHLSNPNLRQPAINRPEEYATDIYNLPVFRYESIYVGLPTVYNHSGNSKVNSDGFSMVELAASRDLIHWERAGNREKFIPLSELAGERNYDTAQLLAANRPIVKDGELWFFYTGLKWRYHPDDVKAEAYARRPDTGAILLAKLRLDGFVSLDAGDAAGTLETKPMIWSGTSLHVNLAAPGGELRAELLDAATGKVIPGFDLTRAEPVRGDHLDAPLRWRNADPGKVAGRTVRLRFELRRGSLYAYWTR